MFAFINACMLRPGRHARSRTERQTEHCTDMDEESFMLIIAICAAECIKLGDDTRIRNNTFIDTPAWWQYR